MGKWGRSHTSFPTLSISKHKQNYATYPPPSSSHQSHTVMWSWGGFCMSEGTIQKQKSIRGRLGTENLKVQPSVSFVKNVFLFSRKEKFSSFILKGTCCYWFKVWLWSHSGHGSWLSPLYGNMLFPRLWQVPEGGPGFCLLWHFRCSRGNTMLTSFSYCFWKAVPACCSCCYPVSAVIRRCLNCSFEVCSFFRALSGFFVPVKRWKQQPVDD